MVAGMNGGEGVNLEDPGEGEGAAHAYGAPHQRDDQGQAGRHELEHTQEQGEIRADLTADDIPRFLVMGVAGLVLPGTAPSTRARFLALLFDALNPANATPLPPLRTEEGDLRTAISNVRHS
jgi:hypothetical protein